MKKTMLDSLKEVIADCGNISSFAFSVKCKTSDGMICTLNQFHVDKKDCPKEVTFPEYADSECIKWMNSAMYNLETNEIVYSCVENMCIRSSTINRIWIEHEYNECN